MNIVDDIFHMTNHVFQSIKDSFSCSGLEVT